MSIYACKKRPIARSIAVLCPSFTLRLSLSLSLSLTVNYIGMFRGVNQFLRKEAILGDGYLPRERPSSPASDPFQFR
jgi:hypothetical protein